MNQLSASKTGASIMAGPYAAFVAALCTAANDRQCKCACFETANWFISF